MDHLTAGPGATRIRPSAVVTQERTTPLVDLPDGRVAEALAWGAGDGRAWCPPDVHAARTEQTIPHQSAHSTLRRPTAAPRVGGTPPGAIRPACHPPFRLSGATAARPS